MTRARQFIAAAASAAVAVGTLTLAAAPVAAAPVGQGFNLNASDLRFILKQIKIAEQHSDTLTASDPCGTMRGTGADPTPARGSAT